MYDSCLADCDNLCLAEYSQNALFSNKEGCEPKSNFELSILSEKERDFEFFDLNLSAKDQYMIDHLQWSSSTRGFLDIIQFDHMIPTASEKIIKAFNEAHPDNYRYSTEIVNLIIHITDNIFKQTKIHCKEGGMVNYCTTNLKTSYDNRYTPSNATYIEWHTDRVDHINKLDAHPEKWRVIIALKGVSTPFQNISAADFYNDADNVYKLDPQNTRILRAQSEKQGAIFSDQAVHAFPYIQENRFYIRCQIHNC